jgi:hypothetical protein
LLPFRPCCLFNASKSDVLQQFVGAVQAQRLQMKLYAQLQLQPDQRAAMAERWRSWCRRRRGLDHQQAAAVQQLQARP